MTKFNGKYNGKTLEQTLDNSASHVADKNNPHGVTAKQLGLDDVIHYETVEQFEYDAAADGEPFGKLVVEVQQLKAQLLAEKADLEAIILRESQRAKTAEADVQKSVDTLAAQVMYYDVMETI